MPILDWFKDRFRRQAGHLLYVAVPADHVRHSDGAAADGTALVPGQDYFRLVATEMFLKNDRDWFSSWHPAVHAAITFELGGKKEVLTSVLGQTKLKSIETKHLDRFLALNQEMTGLLPFNSGSVTLDAGLLAMQGGNDVKDLIKVMGDFGAILAVPQLSAAVKVAEPLADAIGSLVGATNGELMTGLNQTFSEQGGGTEAVFRAGYYAMLDAKDGYQREKFWVDKDQLKYGNSIDDNNALTGVNYVLFRVERRDKRDDWDQLPSIQEPYKNVLKALQSGNVEEAKTHLKAAIAAALEAPELTKKVDRRRVVTQLREKFEADKADLGAAATRRVDFSLQSLMNQSPPARDVASKPVITASEALAGL